MDFSAILKDLRESRGVTQEEIAKYLKVSRSTIAGYETKRRQPDYDKLVKISKYFDVSIDYLLSCEDTEELISVVPSPKQENALDRSVIEAYKKLGFKSKRDVLEYIKLLELREESKKQDSLL